MERLAIALASLVLAGCSGTPDCGASATLDLIDQAVVEYVEKRATAMERDPDTFNPKIYDADKIRQLADNYEVSNIRMLEHDTETDSYECDATITYSYDGKEKSVDFQYRIDTEQSSGEPMIEYENKIFTPILIVDLW